MSVNIGIIGCGYWGPNLVRNFTKISDSKVIFVSDLDQSRLNYIKKLFPNLEVVRDYKKILENKNIDAIAIATPISTHFQIARDALSCKKHVLVEKPITKSLSEARQLIEIAKKNNRVLMVGHTFQYNQAVRKLRDIIKKGELGKVLYAYTTRVNLGLFQDDINVIWDLCPHDISILNYLFDSIPKSVKANAYSHYKKGIEDTGFVLLHYPGNIISHLHVSWLDPLKVRRAVLVGDKKMAVYDDLNAVEPIKIFNKGIIKQAYYDTFGEFKLMYNRGDIYSPKVENVEPLETECKHFLGCIKDNLVPLSDGKSGLEVVKVLEPAQKSLENNGKTIRV